MISIVIPTYKNKELFLKNLKHNITFFSDCELVIVNDNPEEDLSKDLRPYKCILIQNPANLGFAESMNKGVEKAKGEYLLFLNNDVLLKDNSFKKTLNHFSKDNSLFAIGFSQIEKDERIVGKNRIYYKNGFIHHDRSRHLSSGVTAWAEGGTCIVKKSLFNRLGGFDPLYSPFYWEDIDLSYRAWKTGLKVIFSTAVEVEHHHESTIGAYYSQKQMKSIAFRNQLIFIWKNVTDSSLLLKHFLLLMPNLLRLTLHLDFSYLKGFVDALTRLPLILAAREKVIHTFKFTDHEILSQFT